MADKVKQIEVGDEFKIQFEDSWRWAEAVKVDEQFAWYEDSFSGALVGYERFLIDEVRRKK